jgi:hypothetical protein
MKCFVTTLALISLPVMACPDLVGTYKVCRNLTYNNVEAKDLKVTQKIEKGVTVYTFTSTDSDNNETQTETFRADGKTIIRSEVDRETGSKMSLATTVTCTNDRLVTKMVLKVDNELLSDITTTYNKRANLLGQWVKGSNMGEDMDEIINCE